MTKMENHHHDTIRIDLVWWGASYCDENCTLNQTSQLWSQSGSCVRCACSHDKEAWCQVMLILTTDQSFGGVCKDCFYLTFWEFMWFDALDWLTAPKTSKEISCSPSRLVTSQDPFSIKWLFTSRHHLFNTFGWIHCWPSVWIPFETASKVKWHGSWSLWFEIVWFLLWCLQERFWILHN